MLEQTCEAVIYLGKKLFKVFFSSVLEQAGLYQPKILEQSWSKLSKLEKSSTKLFFLSYRKQFKQFGEHQSHLLNNWWAKIGSCNSFQARDHPKWNFLRWKTVWRTSTNVFPANLEPKDRAIYCSERQVPPKCSSHQVKNCLGIIKQIFRAKLE